MTQPLSRAKVVLFLSISVLIGIAYITAPLLRETFHVFF